MKIESSRQFLKNPQISNFKKIHPMVAETFHEEGRIDRRTDMNKPIVTYHKSEDAPKM